VIEKLTTNNDPEQSLISYEKRLQDNPNDYESWYNRGIALRVLGRYEEAIAGRI
jgi:tetratricopeptide (TPR) repeat protein